MTCDVRLTLRQQQIVSLLQRGLVQKDIAAALGLSQSTIKNHVETLLQTLDARSATHACAMVARCEMSRV